MTEQIETQASEPTEQRTQAVSTVEQLVAARQAAGLGASDVASRLGMATRQIEAIERGDWPALPGQAFVRAALRAYGKAIAVDVEPLLSSLGPQVAAPELKASASLESPMPRGGSFGFGGGGSGGRLAWILLGIAAVIAIVFYFGPAFELGERQAGGDTAGLAESQSAAPSIQPAAPSNGAAAPAAGSGGAPAAGTATGGAAAVAPAGATATGQAQESGAGVSLAPLVPLAPASPPGSPAAASGAAGTGGSASASAAAPSAVSPGAAASAAAASSSSASPSAAPAQAADAPAAGASGTETLRLRFARESWVEIREAGGKILLTGLQQPGTERELSGRKPLTLVIGNAEHVTLERGGKPVDLAARARQGVARLTLD